MANPFANWTPQMAQEHNARVAGTTKLGKAYWDSHVEKKVSAQATAPKAKKPLMNKTESAFYEILKARGYTTILCQSVMLRLGDGCQYRPDFVVIEPALDGAVRITCYETKAPHRYRKEGITKVKVAAHQYPFMRFFLVMRDKGKWTEKEIGV